jgi:hypothetical protein
VAYIAPAGNIADFQIGTGSFPRPYNGLTFRQTSPAYAPPVGNVVEAQFPTPGADWTAPAGNTVNFFVVRLIEFSGDGSAIIPITAAGVGAHGVSGVGAVTVEITAVGAGQFSPRTVLKVNMTGRWATASRRMVPLNAPSPAAIVRRDARRGAWAVTKAGDVCNRLPWGTTRRLDNGRAVSWASYAVRSNVTARTAWHSGTTRDDENKLPWGKYGPMLALTSKDGWVSSRSADKERIGAWRGHLIPTLRKLLQPRPSGDACNFSVIGGGIDCAVFPGVTYASPIGNALHFQFGNTTYRVPFMPPAVAYVSPAGNAVKFLYTPQYVLILDGTGQPVLDKSIRDPGQLYPWGLSKSLDSNKWIPWSKYSRPMNPGWGVVTPGGPVQPTPGNPVIIPVKRVYIVVNEVLLVRVVGNVPIIAENLNVGFDCDSWLPTFSATIPESARDAIMPDPNPVELLAYINGSEFRLLIEKIVRNRTFGKNTVSISGRGIACELNAPYATVSQHTNSIAQTAQQLIDTALANTTYTQTWGISDWLVPAGVFSLNGTPAEVAAAVADASGSVLQADWVARDLRMIPRYPVKPWDWATATPDYTIPAAVAQMESVEWLEKPDYNVVYVSGTQQGVIAQVKRAGTAGDKPANMYTNPLITHAAPAGQKGSTILCETGRKAMMQISMPVLAETGVIDVCSLIEFSDGGNTRRGLVRANSISVGMPTVRQTLTIEAAA